MFCGGVALPMQSGEINLDFFILRDLITSDWHAQSGPRGGTDAVGVVPPEGIIVFAHP